MRWGQVWVSTSLTVTLFQRIKDCLGRVVLVDKDLVDLLVFKVDLHAEDGLEGVLGRV